MKRITAVILCILLLLFLPACKISPDTSKNTNTNDNYSNNNHKIKTHQVTYIVDNNEHYKIAVQDGEALESGYNPYKENYIFKGWYTDSLFTVPYDFSRPVKNDFKLYAAFTLKRKEIHNNDLNIKALSNTHDNDQSVFISLSGFDYNYLEANSMGLQFKIEYEVKYTKDYDVLFDIGYAGSPKYELTLINDEGTRYFEKNLPTTTSEAKCCYTYNTVLDFSKNKQITLTFSTDNIQNIITFSDIVITVEAIKLR